MSQYRYTPTALQREQIRRSGAEVQEDYPATITSTAKPGRYNIHVELGNDRNMELEQIPIGGSEGCIWPCGAFTN